MAHLDKIIVDPNKRKPIYQVFAAVGLVIGGVQVAFASAQIGQPVWLTVALSVYAFMGAAGFTLSQANTHDDVDVLESEVIYDIADETTFDEDFDGLEDDFDDFDEDH